MARKYIDCREIPSDSNCSVDKHHDTPEFRSQIKQAIKEGTPPLKP